jgi:hypothetical protein
MPAAMMAPTPRSVRLIASSERLRERMSLVVGAQPIDTLEPKKVHDTSLDDDGRCTGPVLRPGLD